MYMMMMFITETQLGHQQLSSYEQSSQTFFVYGRFLVVKPTAPASTQATTVFFVGTGTGVGEYGCDRTIWRRQMWCVCVCRTSRVCTIEK